MGGRGNPEFKQGLFPRRFFILKNMAVLNLHIGRLIKTVFERSGMTVPRKMSLARTLIDDWINQ